MNFLSPPHERPRKRTKLFWLLGLLCLAIIVVWWGGRVLVAGWQRSPPPLATSLSGTATVFERFLGFDRPKTYLVLLLNNTELRPGGGFIGAYAVLQMKSGQPTILKVEGSEFLDRRAASTTLDVPPAPIGKYLKVNRWYFRDSNWSPDFARSSEQVLSLYRREGGVAGSEIDAVIGITPTVIVELLALMGPITVAGQTYSSEQFVEQLEYEVEYGHAERGISQSDRKNVIGELARVILKRLPRELVTRWNSYSKAVEAMFAEKQLMIYSLDPAVQEFVRRKQWSGELRDTSGDYMLWVDANLGAWKTDASINRALSFSVTPTTTGHRAAVTMHYDHQGQFDWRTTRYQTYARVFAPLGSRLIGVRTKSGRAPEVRHIPAVVDSGQEQGREWWGIFFSLEPQESGSVTFEYTLSPRLKQSLAQGRYQLIIQKQLGMPNLPLTVALDFDKKVITADPVSVSPSDSQVFHFKGQLKSSQDIHLQLDALR